MNHILLKRNEKYFCSNSYLYPIDSICKYFAIFFFICIPNFQQVFYFKVTCSFIILNFKDEIDQRKTSFCVLKKSNNEDDDNFVVYRLVDILGRNSSINICKGVNYNINMNFSSNSTSKYEFAAYFEMDINFDRPCSFQSLINGVTPNNTALRLRVVIIGTNGPVKANSKVNVSAVFLPKISSKDLRVNFYF